LFITSVFKSSFFLLPNIKTQMTQLQTNTNNEFDSLSSNNLNNRKTTTMFSWWWCATIIGIIPTVVANILFKKVEPRITRPQLPSVTSAMSTTQLDVGTGTRNHLLGINPTVNFVAPVVPNIGEVNITTPLTARNTNDFIWHDIQINQHPYINDVIDHYDHHVNHGEILPIADQQQKNQDTLTFLRNNDYLEVKHIACSLHIGTIVQATKELMPMLEETRKHFKCTTNTRLSRSEINFWFGKFILPKVLAHLSNDKKFNVDGHNIAMTAQEIIYYYFERTGRVLPHRHLLTEFYPDDIQRISQLCILPHYYTDHNNQMWEIEGPFLKPEIIELGRCLFQFPSPELYTAIALH